MGAEDIPRGEGDTGSHSGTGSNQTSHSPTGTVNRGNSGAGDAIPGVKGKDYKLVQIGGIVYAVYNVDLGLGTGLKVAWRIKPADFAAFDIDISSVPKISQGAFGSIQIMGNASEVARTDMEETHPFEVYLRELRRTYGDVSWLHNKQFMKIFLEGWVEQWSEAELEERLKRTTWYNSRTDQQRTWEMQTGKQDRKTSVRAIRNQMSQALESLLGPTMDLAALGLNEGELAKAALNIASGKFGSSSDGLAMWVDKMRHRIEGINGSQAWIDKQLAIEKQRDFANRPEDMLEQLRDEAFSWLGPSGVPDNGTLKKWAKNIVTGISSEGDWQKFLRNQSKALYPWLGEGEGWQDRASSYKSQAEATLGKPVAWNDPLLQNLGGQNADGSPNGQALSYDLYEQQLRKTDAFWSGSTARQEGWDLLGFLQNTFTGVGN